MELQGETDPTKETTLTEMVDILGRTQAMESLGVGPGTLHSMLRAAERCPSPVDLLAETGIPSLEVLNEEIEQLPDHPRCALVWRYGMERGTGRTLSEVASLLGLVNRQAADYHVRRGVAMLRHRAEEMGR